MKNFNFLSKTRWLLVPLMLITFGIGQMWGETSPITITTNSSGITSTGQITNFSTYKLTFTNVTDKGNNFVQNAKSSNIYNTVTIPGPITSIKLTNCATTSSKTDGSFTIYGGTTQANCTTSIGEVTGLSSTAADKTVNFPSNSNYTFFKITVGSARVLKISSIVISYTAGSSTTYTVTYNLNGGSGTTPSETNKAAGASFSLHNGTTGITAPTGKVFSQWKDQDNNYYNGGVSYTMPAKAVTLTAQWSCIEPTINTQPASANYAVGATPTALSVSATLSSGTLTYLWKVSTNGGSTWSNASGTNNTATYAAANISTASAGTTKYKCIVTNSSGSCSTESDVATITVYATHKAYFYNGDNLLNTGGTDVAEGAAVTYSGSNPSSCETGSGKSSAFVGWATDTWSGKVAKANIPTGTTFYDITASESLPVMGTSDVTYYAVFAKATSGGSSSVFSEDFSSCTGTGGNDNSWNGSIATTTLPTAISSSWSITYGNAASSCIKLGSGSSTGHAITPSIDCGSATTATLTFRAGAWNHSDDGTTLALTFTNCSGDKSSVTLEKGSFTEYTVNLSNITGAIKIDFYVSNGSKHRFFLDDVEVTCAGSTTYSNYLTTCCTELGSIKGSVSWTNGKATVHCENLAGVSNWGVEYKLHDAENYTTYNGSANWETYDDQATDDMRKIALNDLNLVAGSQYDFKVTGSYTGSSYCPGAFEAALDPKTSYYVPQMGDPSESSITGLGYIVGAATSAAQSFTISASHLTENLTVTAPGNFQVSKTGADADDFASTATLIPTSGSLTNAEVWVRLAIGLEENTYGGNSTYVTINGGGAAGKQVSVIGVVGPACHKPSISGSLSDATYNLNADADALTISASKGDESDPDLSYQWMQCATSDGTYVNVVSGTGATTNSYTPSTTTAGSNLYYKCKVSSGNCFDYSDVAHIQVNTPVIKLNNGTSNINLAFGDKAVDAVTGYTLTFDVSGQYLGENIGIAKSGTNEAMFTLSASSVTKQNDGTASTTITVTYKPSAAGEHSAALTLTSAQATNRTVSLSGTGKWLVTWNVANQENPFTNLAANEAKPTLPESAPSHTTLDCANTFMGWSKKNGGSTSRDTQYYDDLFKDAEHAPAINAATPFYAVFGTQIGNDPSYITFDNVASDGTSDISGNSESVNAKVTASDGISYNSTGSSKVYTGEYGMKIGTGSATGTMVFTVSPAVTTKTIKVNAKKYSTDTGTLSVTVNGSTTFGSAQTPSTSGGELTFTVENAVEVTSVKVSTSSKRAYIKTVSVGEGATKSNYVTVCPAVEAPTFSPAAGEYHVAKDVTISCSTDGAQIRYTTNGDAPTKTTGTVYNGAITVDETMTIKAIAVKGDNVSEVATATYTITYPRKVTFNAGAGTLSIAPATSLTEETFGEGITLPTATPSNYCVADGWTFAGWATTNSTTTAPTIVSGTYTPSGDITLYAVYQQGDENYHLVTELPTGEDIPGNYMIVNTSAKKALRAYYCSQKYQVCPADVNKITDGAIDPADITDETNRSQSIWNVTYSDSHWKFTNGAKELYGYESNTYYNISVDANSHNGFNVSLDANGYAVINSVDETNANVYWTGSYFQGTSTASNINVHLYKQSTPTYSSTPACCDDEVTVSKAENPSTGTFTLDKSGVLSTCAGTQVVTVTCTPNAGYHVDAVTETIETDVTIEETAENVYTVTYAKNVSGASTISVTFAETLTPDFQISQNAFEIGDVAVGATVQRQFTISAANLEGTSLSITSDNNKFEVSPTSLTIKTDGSVEEATVTVTLKTTEANIGGPYSATITLADGATTPNTATVSLTNATIKNQYNVKWYNGTTLLSEANYLDGATISAIPTATSCDQSISHVGWLPNATITGKQADKPAGLVTNDDLPAVTADVEYHAVFAKVGEASWRSTALADLTASDIFVIAGNNGSNYAMTNNNGTNAPTATSITIADGKLSSAPADNLKWNISGNATDGYTFYPNGSTTTWLYCTNTNNGVKVGTGDAKVFTVNSGYLYTSQTSNARYIGIYSSQDWRCYETCTGQSNIAGQSFGYFKYIAPAVKDYMTTCAVTFTATYEAGAGTGDDYEDANLIEKNADYTVLGNDVTGFTKTDYRFNGWKCGDDNYAAGTTYENVTADLTFVAQWAEKEEAGLEYATSAYEVIQNGSFAKPTLTNPHDLAVTYSSSNESVATVDAEGNVTLKADAIGSTIITATSEATDTYKAGEASYTLNVASKWALTYTSNVALVENADTKASSATVNSYDAMKCGTTGVAGAMQITVPKNTEKLHIHAVGWNGTNVTLNVTGATAVPNSIDLSSDNAISGGGSSFTLSKPSTFYKEITLSNITEATTLTLEATSGNRFVVYGVNEEGGIWELPSNDADESDIPSEVNVVVSNNQSLTINNAKTLNNLTVEAGGNLALTAGESKKLTVNDMTIKSEAGKSGQVTGTNVKVDGDIYLEIKLDASGTMDPHKWYCISAPFAVSAFEWGNGTPMVFNVDYQLFEYQGDKRARTGNGWQRVGGTMKANTAYFTGFDDTNANNQNVIKLKANSNTIPTAATMHLDGHSSEIEGSNDWYGLGNPALHYVGVNKTAHVFGYEVQGYDVVPHWSTDFTGFVVGTAFFVQANDFDLTFNNTATAYHAPKRQAEEYTYCVEISREGSSRYDNRVFVRASEDAESEFVQGKDEYTLNNTTSNYGALLWTENYGGKRLAIEDAPLVNGTASYVLTMSAPKAGTYSISVADPQDNADLYLTYDGTIIWNLSESAYTVDLNQGVTNGYGLILRAKAPSVVTGVDQIDAKAGAQKVIIDEHVFILRGGQMYDVNGKMVK